SWHTMWVAGIILLLSTGVYSSIQRFTNVKCEVLDPSYCSYKQCELKILDRNVVGLNVHALLLKGPFNNAKVNLGLWRKYNSYQPYMLNSTFDFCKMLLTSKHQLSFERIFFDAVAPYSNVNHSCPYKNEIVIRDWVLHQQQLKYLPLPSGEYQLKLMGYTDKDYKFILYITFSVT
ncbi:hypothetical protein KR044_010238, partial [Drosophila immigrans]